MKPEAVNEHDLLALIEGDLDAERALVVRAALAKDPRLLVRVEAMKSDREVLRGLFADAQTDAPGGLVRDAILIAEREGLVVEAPAPAAARIVIKQRRIARPMAAGLSLAAMLGVIGAGAVLVVSLSKSDEQRASEAKGPPEYFISVPEPEEEEFDDTVDQFIQKMLPDQKSASPEALGRLAHALASEDGPKGKELAGPVEHAVTHGGPTLLPETFNLWAGLFEDDGPGVTVQDAAQLAMENRLELTISAEDTGAWAQASGQVLAMGELQATTGLPTAAGQGSRESLHFTIEITVPWDENLTALQDELLRLRGRMNRRTGVRQAMYQAVSKPELVETLESLNEHQLDAGVLPSREVQHVLWWTRPTSSWERHISVRVPITIMPASETP